jgi:Tyosinase C-terminal domain
LILSSGKPILTTTKTFHLITRLHHVHIDRLAAIWQAIHPNYVIEPLNSERPRYTAKTGTLEGVITHLEPFHKTAEHSMEDYHTTNDTKEVTQTFSSGYYYPETPLELLKDPEKMRIYAVYKARELYGPPLRYLGGQPQDDAQENPPLVEKNWQVFLRVKNFALSGTWGVHIFFGEPPTHSDDWFMAENRVGTISILANNEMSHCQNCQEQAAQGILVTGSVDLNSALGRASQDIGDTAAVVDYLRENLTWRVAKVFRVLCAPFSKSSVF